MSATQTQPTQTRAMMRHLALSAITVLTVATTVHAEPSWLAWGGPGADFHSPAAKLAESWPESGPTALWSRDLGPGYSSVLADGDRLYTAYRRDDDDVVIALDVATGTTIWERAYPAPPREGQATDYGKGPHAAPLLHGGNLFTVTASGVLHATDQKSGEAKWSHDLVETYGTKLPYWGYSAAPIAHDGKIIVLTGGEHGARGFDPKSGKQVWSSDALPISYAAPLVIEVGGEEQLLFMTPNEVVGVALGDGGVRWRHPHKNQWDTNCIGPWWGSDGLLFVSSMGEAGSRTLRLSRKDGKTSVEEVSTNSKIKLAHSTAIRLGDHLYGSSDDYLVAYDVESGEIGWREKGYEKTNLVAIGDRLIGLDETGKLSMLSVTPKKLTVLASHQLLTKPAWTAPTVIGSKLYVRDQKTLVALDLAPTKAAAKKAATQPSKDE